MSDLLSKVFEWIFHYKESFLEMFELKVLWTFILTISSFLIGDVSPWIVAVFVIYAIDFLIWVSKAIYRDEFDPTRFARWFVKFIFYWTALIVWNQIDIIMSEVTGVLGTWYEVTLARLMIIAYIWLHESLSLLTKLNSLGVPVPKLLVNRLKLYEEHLDDNETTHLHW